MTRIPTTPLGPLPFYHYENRSLLLNFDGPRAAITILTPHIFRVRLAPDGAFAPRRSWSVACHDEDFPFTPFEIEESGTTITLHPQASEHEDTAPVNVHIQRSPCRISFSDIHGHVFCRDETGIQWRERDPNRPHQTWTVACTKHKEKGEHFFGFGQRTGPLNKTGYRMTNWTTDPGTRQGPTTDPLYISIPIFLSVRPGLAYGIFFNNTWHSTFDIEQERTGAWRMEAAGGEMDYYVVYGPTPAHVLERLGCLLGTMPLAPRWAIGYHQSRWSYAPDIRVRQIAAEFRNRRIPCDVLHLDIAYMDGYRVFTWDHNRFPNPQQLIADLQHQGFRVVTIIDPGVKVDPNYDVYQQGLERGYFICRSDGQVFQGYVWPDDSVFSDYTRPEVREWWGDWQRRLVEQGVRGIWNDMNEPPVFDQPFSQEVGKRTWGTIPLDARQGIESQATTHAEVHNLFAYGMARASYEGLRRHMPNERPFVLTRSGFAGTQRWSACWMGDNSSVWEHLEMAMPQLLNMGLSGIPFVGVDIGGFAGNASGELFARWMQFGILMPFCRGHTTHFSKDHEPWAFGPQIESICKTYLQLRYRLLPYLYTLFWEASMHGTPILRPLLFHFPDDTYTYTLHDQVMLGPFLMAAPIYQPGRAYRSVYLPEGEWYDWWTNEVILGPTTILAHAPLEKMPLYVRAGAILPSGPDMCYTDEKALDPLTLDLYPGNGAFTLYEDDGHTFAYEQGQYCTTGYTLQRQTDCATNTTMLRFDICKRSGEYIPPNRRIIVRIHAMDECAASTYPDTEYDPEQRLMQIEMRDEGKPCALEFGCQQYE